MPFAENFNCYAQKVDDIYDGDLRHCELLTRPKLPGKHESIEALFASLPIEHHLEIFEWQVGIAHEQYPKHKYICSINVDNAMLLDESSKATVLRIAQESTVPLVLEFTEVHPMAPVELINPLFNQLRAAGHSTSLDDFGTGFNGMSLFVDYDFDIIKIDRSLIADIAERPKKSKVLALLAQMITALGKKHVVEGVEDENQLKTLQKLGFRTFQGHHFHEAEPVEAFF